MTLEPGARLGPYEIVGSIGEGGMGEVYRAEDTRLKRDVAIKVLPAELANDSERIARMEREAQVLASLEHPNIAALYGFEEAEVEFAEALLSLQRVVVLFLHRLETSKFRQSALAFGIDL